MLTLAIDTALNACSVAIVDGERVLADLSEPMERGHAERIAPMAREALDEAKLKVADFDCVGVVIGPGAFAGVRVGLAFARGLALGNRLSVIGISSLAALAAGAPSRKGDLIAPVIDARRGQVYAALYDGAGGELAPAFVETPAIAADKLAEKAGGSTVSLVGDGAGLIDVRPNFMVVKDYDQIDPKVVARLAAGAPKSDQPPAPIYLRPPDAKRGKPSRFAGLLADLEP